MSDSVVVVFSKDGISEFWLWKGVITLNDQTIEVESCIEHVKFVFQHLRMGQDFSVGNANNLIPELAKRFGAPVLVTVSQDSDLVVDRYNGWTIFEFSCLVHRVSIFGYLGRCLRVDFFLHLSAKASILARS